MTAAGWRTHVRWVAGGGIGNFIEWYDWAVYALLAPVFSAQIFPAGNAVTSLLASLVTFAVGFLLRPLGAILLSPYGDRHGRQRLLSLTIVLMGAGSLLIAIVPPYAVIGLGAPVLFLLARIVQGISAGGEFQSSSAYLVEHATPGRRGLVGSLQLVSIAVGTLVATAVAGLTNSLLPGAALAAWGWRLPFLLGALLSVYGLYLRFRAPETPAFKEAEASRALEAHPLLAVLRQRPLDCLRVVGIQMMTVPYYLWTTFLATYAHLTSKLPLSLGLLGSTIALAVFTVCLPLAGALSDRVGRKPLLVAAAAGFVVLSYPFFLLLQHAGFWTFLLVDVAGCLVLTLVDGPMAATFCELFPTSQRASGIGVPYALTSAVFSGTAPLIAAALVQAGQPIAIAYYVMAIALFSLVLCVTMPELRGRSFEPSAVASAPAPVSPEPLS